MVEQGVLPDWTYQRAKRREITQSQLVREYLYHCLNEDLADDDPGLAIIGIGKRSDTALNHDQYLVAEEKPSWVGANLVLM